MKIKEKQWGAKKNGCIFSPHTAKKKKVEPCQFSEDHVRYCKHLPKAETIAALRIQIIFQVEERKCFKEEIF